MLFFEPVSFAAQLINLVEHSFQERFCRCSGNPSPLKLADFAALTLNLGAHSLDFVPDSIAFSLGQSLFDLPEDRCCWAALARE